MYQKRIKYLRLHLTTSVQDLYTENYKTSRKVIEENTSKWRDSCPRGLEELIVLKSVLIKVVHRLNTIPVKIPITFFIEMEQGILKFVWDQKTPQEAKAILRKKNKPSGIIPPDFKLYFVTI